MATFEASVWKEALSSVKSQFEIDMLLPEQEDAIRAFMEKGNLFVNLPTLKFRSFSNAFPLLLISCPQDLVAQA